MYFVSSILRAGMSACLRIDMSATIKRLDGSNDLAHRPFPGARLT
jgi:hypothetical protein